MNIQNIKAFCHLQESTKSCSKLVMSLPNVLHPQPLQVFEWLSQMYSTHQDKGLKRDSKFDLVPKILYVTVVNGY